MSPRFAALALPSLIGLLALAAPLAAHADAAPAEASAPDSSGPALRPLVGVLFTIGQGEGSKVGVPDANGDMTARVDLAGIVDVYAGAEFPLAPNGLALQLTAGVHQTSSSNGVSARRFPLEALLLYPVSPSLRVGGGVRYPAHLRFSGGAESSAGLSSTPSIVGLVEVKMSQHLALDFRYVKEQYQRAESAGRFDASHFDAGVQAIY